MPPRNELIRLYQSQGWNDMDSINADIDAGGWRSKVPSGSSGDSSSGSDPAVDINAAIEDAFNKLNTEVAKRWGEYKSNNPFRIDEVLASKSAEAKEQIDPYYNETLSDYLTGVERKISRGTQDTRDMLAELQADTSSFSRDIQFGLDQAINKSREGFAGAGLYSSGQRYGAEGLLQRRAGDELSDFTRGQEFREKGLRGGLSRGLEDIALGRKMDVRNLERERFTEIGKRQSQLAKEQGQRFTTGFRATLPPELQAQSGFDILQDLGLYS